MSSVFLLGATGFIGGALLAALRGEHSVTRLVAFVRDPLKAKLLDGSGVEIIVGNSEYFGDVLEHSSNADIIINAARSDSIGLIQAILAGQRRYYQKNSKRSILIHISRSALDLHHDRSLSLGLQTATLNDLDSEPWVGTRFENMSRIVDNEIMDADSDAYMTACIIAPTIVYGEPNTQIPRRSHPLRNLVQCSLRRGQMILPSDGMNMGNAINLQDLVNLCVLVLRLQTGPAINVKPAFPKVIFASSSTFRWGDVAQQIAIILYRRKRLAIPGVFSCQPTEHPELREYSKNAWVEPVRAKSLGWVPASMPTIFDKMEKELDGILVDLEDSQRLVKDK